MTEETVEQAAAQQDQPKPPIWKRPAPLIAAGLIILLIVFIVVQNRPSPLEAAEAACEEDAPGAIHWAGQGRIDIIGAYTENPQAQDGFAERQADAFLCISRELDMPQRVRSDIDQTTAMQGQRTAEWDDIEAYWTYHPERGLDISFEEQ